MASTTSHYPENLRLVHLLSGLSETKLSHSKHNLAERLGHLIGLSGSVTLARALQELPQSADKSPLDGGDNLQAMVLAKRERIIRKITASFAHENIGLSSLGVEGSTPSKTSSSAGVVTQTKVPSADASIREQALQTFEPYRRFYVAQQLEMAVAIQALRTEVRSNLAKVSMELNQLVELDKVLEHSLAAYNRNSFNVTLKVLERHFKSLLQSHLKLKPENGSLQDWLKPDAWLDIFYQDMRELLLAEFDVRLQPVLGLLEALNENTRI